MTTEANAGFRAHGGPDQLGVPLFDFSTNSNACGPSPHALAAVNQADPTQYPDASYSTLRQQLADFHRVALPRVVLAASASEFIFRITALAALRGARSVSLPPHGYGDYAQAAHAHRLPCSASLALSASSTSSAALQLRWSCDPSSPLGAAHLDWALAADGWSVVDRAYEPLRLDAALALSASQLESVWQLWTPNKALGLTGVRAAYAIAPQGADEDVRAMEARCPSWAIGAHGVAMLQAWTSPQVQGWLTASLAQLRLWKAQQTALCESFGWTVLASNANFFVCDWQVEMQSIANRKARGWSSASALIALRGHGIKLRDCTSFGLPGHVRLSVQPPAAQDALSRAWRQIAGGAT